MGRFSSSNASNLIWLPLIYHYTWLLQSKVALDQKVLRWGKREDGLAGDDGELDDVRREEVLQSRHVREAPLRYHKKIVAFNIRETFVFVEVDIISIVCSNSHQCRFHSGLCQHRDRHFSISAAQRNRPLWNPQTASSSVNQPLERKCAASICCSELILWLQWHHISNSVVHLFYLG